MHQRHIIESILILLALVISPPALADTGEVAIAPSIAAARRSVAEGLVGAGVDPETAADQVMQLTVDDLRVLVANPAMLQRAGAGESGLVFLIIIIAILAIGIAAGASGFISVG